MNNFHPTHFTLVYSEGDKKCKIKLHKVDAEDLTERGVGAVHHNGVSIGSVELIDGSLIVNDEKDEALLYVKDVLSDLI